MLYFQLTMHQNVLSQTRWRSSALPRRLAGLKSQGPSNEVEGKWNEEGDRGKGKGRREKENRGVKWKEGRYPTSNSCCSAVSLTSVPWAGGSGDAAAGRVSTTQQSSSTNSTLHCKQPVNSSTNKYHVKLSTQPTNCKIQTYSNVNNKHKHLINVYYYNV